MSSFLKKLKRAICRKLYYAFANKLPASTGRGGERYRRIRFFFASRFVKSCGRNVNFEHGAHFDSDLTIGDFSAAVTGLLLGLNLPSTVPLWLPVIGNVFAILFVKQLFGGLGQNFMNPALAGRCFLLISFAGRMTDFTWDGVSSATPLAALKAGESVQVLDMFLGKTAGTIGETSVIAILIGAIVLLWFEVIDLRIPGSYILSFAVCTLLFGGHGLDFGFLLAELCGGGLMLGAFFMATDYVTSPITKSGQIVYGIALGILTAIFRYLGSAAEGVSYAIIIGNLLVPVIEKVTEPTAFGREPFWKRGKKA